MNNYFEQLKQTKWKQKRFEILERDKHTCQECGRKPSQYEHIKENPIAIASFKDFLEKMNVEVKEVENDRFILKYKEDKEYDLNEIVYNFSLKFTPKFGKSLHPLRDYPHSLEDDFVAYFLNSSVDLSEPLGIGLFYCENFKKPQESMSLRESFLESGKIKYMTLQIFPMNSYKFYKEKTSILNLQVHHKYYISNHKAWEYNEKALVTLCNICHEKEHQESDIYIYESQNQADEMREGKITHVCHRCDGSGYLPQYHYVDNGVCYACGGEGVNLV